MKMSFQERERRRDWARRNPFKVKESNRRYRALRDDILRRQARERMRRWRAKHARLRALSTSRNAGTGDPK
jgi:uncharacterized protein involved in type VI secretion and phage assembly